MRLRNRIGLWWAKKSGKDSYTWGSKGGTRISLGNLQGKTVTWDPQAVVAVPPITPREPQFLSFQYDTETGEWTCSAG